MFVTNQIPSTRSALNNILVVVFTGERSCRFFNTPVTGGNVSFYNESPDTAVYPTPVIGMVGLVEDLKHVTTSTFKNAGDLIYLLGEDFEEMGGSEFSKVVYDIVKGEAPKIDLAVEKKLQDTLLNLIRAGFIKSAHDISEGGILTAITECCFIDKEKIVGAEVNIPVKSREDFSLFSESQSRVIVSIGSKDKEAVEKILNENGLTYTFLGVTKESGLSVNGKYSFDLAKLAGLYYNSISGKMNVVI